MNLNIVYAGESFLVEGDYTPAEPETGPTYDCGGTPGSPEDFEITGLMLEGEDRDGLACYVNLTNLLQEEAFSDSFLDGLTAATLERIHDLGQ